jgi:hypothetical protein
MKKTIAFILTGFTALSLVACGKTDAEVPAQDTTEVAAEEVTTAAAEESTTELVGMANPWVDITEEEANAKFAKLFKAPEGATNVSWSEMPSAADPSGFPSELVQMNFTLDNMDFTARIQATTEDKADISGMFYEWTATNTGILAGWAGGNMPANFYRYVGDSEMADLCSWYDIETGYAYTLGVTAPDLEGFDIQAVAEAIYAPENEPGFNMPSDAIEPTIDITGCDTFTQIVDKLPAGYGYANASFGGTDVLLVADYIYDNNAGEGDVANVTTEADVFFYNEEGVPTFAGRVNSGGTAYPITISGDRLMTGGNHYVRCYSFMAGGLVIEEEASVVYDTNGGETYYITSDTHDTGADENGQVADSKKLDELFEEFNNGEVVLFDVVG